MTDRVMIAVAVLVSGLAVALAVFLAGRFEAVSSGPWQVWRTDRITGAVSYCSLDDGRPVCRPAQQLAR